ncbi:phosphoglucomutase/phosphomannomutase family protein [Neosynechococcus sphagnicola]|uniref:phosphoglucomutase/phosphomannomutase family protein n=1 Tax=Neosynechococcus sphagnicola TaxID=1501145 RepID=UPI000AB2FC0A|nr:phosphoglucomutase/phosphomannomutase family protein [Neosynechococcus sphagnicola]
MGVGSSSRQIHFGTDGWRGIIAQDFTFAKVRQVTQAIARYLQPKYRPERPVIVGYDTRFLADRFAEAAAETLAGLGWRVKIAERDCPTPAIAYQVKHLNAAGALMFTASHNPPNYCGLKYIPDYAGPATTEITDGIVAQLSGGETLPPKQMVGDNPAIFPFDPQPDYLKFLYSQVDQGRIRSARLRVSYDALYSTSRGYLDTALTACGCQVTSFHNYRDVLFGGGLPEPSPQQLSALITAVEHDQTDFGLATDGDGDRFGIVDNQGNILSADTVLLLLARHLLLHKGKTGAIVRTVATTHLLDQLATAYGLELYETPVGFKYIGAVMRQTSVLIGGGKSRGG